MAFITCVDCGKVYELHGNCKRCSACWDAYRKKKRQELDAGRKEELKLRSRDYYERNKEKVKARVKLYREEAKEVIAEKMKEYQKANLEKYREYNRKYRERNKDTINAKQRKKYHELKMA